MSQKCMALVVCVLLVITLPIYDAAALRWPGALPNTRAMLNRNAGHRLDQRLVESVQSIYIYRNITVAVARRGVWTPSPPLFWSEVRRSARWYMCRNGRWYM